MCFDFPQKTGSGFSTMALLRGAPGCGAEAQRSACGGGDGGGFSGGKAWYHLVMTNIALENPLPIGSMYGISLNSAHPRS